VSGRGEPGEVFIRSGDEAAAAGGGYLVEPRGTGAPSRVWGLGSRILGIRVLGLGLFALGLGFRV
jgi:hypothetical protein